ncbi:MAG: rhomboid family intramembrane serine protease [Synechococcales cyanobacterium C42_A2020_086]|nr:rhomboid family intramembrane serine protease [Synechococcales cyanobacterium C42_A2020_086]
MDTDWQTRARILQDLVVMTWGLNLLNWTVLGRALDWLGIRPRTWIGLLGIGFAPLIHSTVSHLFGNTLAFIVFGWILLLRGIPVFWLVTFTTLLTSGFGVWLLGRGRYSVASPLYVIDSVHMGASGVIFGYLGFLLLNSFFDSHPLALMSSLIVGTFYWNLLPGLLPQQRVSWEGHLFGFLGGALLAYGLPAFAPWLAAP